MDNSYYKSLEPYWGSWKISRQIGQGAYGKVFEVEKEEGSNIFTSAMKAVSIPQTEDEWYSALAEGMDEESVAEYFQGFVKELADEIAMMSSFKGHSNIVSYEDHLIRKRDDGHGWDIFIRMELLTPVIDVLLEQGSMSRDMAIQLGIDICTALEVCANQKLVHRDIKPQNIFISPLGTYKLGDFGIARKLDQTRGALSKNGTTDYMAPEVYKEQEYGRSVDIYSLGMVLYRMLNRNRGVFMPPYPEVIKHTDRSTAFKKRMQGEKFPLPIDAQDALGEVICKACAFLPEDRYRSATDFKNALIAVKMNIEEPYQYQQEEDNKTADTVAPEWKLKEAPVTETEQVPPPVLTYPGLEPAPAPEISKNEEDEFNKTFSYAHNRPIPPKNEDTEKAKVYVSPRTIQKQKKLEADRKWQGDPDTKRKIYELRKSVIDKKKKSAINDKIQKQAMYSCWESRVGALENAIRESDAIAMEVYLICPTEAACNKISEWNSDVGELIRSWYRRGMWEDRA